MSIAMPKAAQLRSQGHLEVAMYFNAISVALWFIALFVLLPRRRNMSAVSVIRALGRFPLLVRCLLVFGLEMALFWIGILYEKIAT